MILCPQRENAPFKNLWLIINQATRLKWQKISLSLDEQQVEYELSTKLKLFYHLSMLAITTRPDQPFEC